MEVIKDWAFLVAVCAILAEVCSMVMPKGQSKKTGMLVLGLILVFALIQPMGDFYKLLQEVDFSYETDRAQITENLAGYTEDQMLEVTKEYKQRLTTYMCQLVGEVNGIGQADVTFIMEEDYEKETYGIVKRIYVTAYRTKAQQPAQTSNSGFSQMAPVEKIEITLDGITLLPGSGQNDVQEEEADPQAQAIQKVLQEAFLLEEDCIFVEVKDE